ncbi:MAG: hypothetical protein RLZZ253_887 [Verrucomicrobiota bacterium]|jgi:D-alanyl-D-alanine carboxypeptidase (penicillin-binding protein 5/6)
MHRFLLVLSLCSLFLGWRLEAAEAPATVRKALPVAPVKPSGASAAPKVSSAKVPGTEASTGRGAPAVQAAAAILVDARSGAVLYEWNADQKRPVASTQKLMTALLVAERGGLEEPVRVAVPDTYAEPSKLYIKPGEIYSRLKLLQVLLVKSMNDVARCLARDHAGSVEAFAERMNQKAQQLGMVNSHFVNPNGLPAKGQYSTARDMSVLARAAYRNKALRGITCMKSLTWTYPDGSQKVFNNTNRVLTSLSACNGLKTGYTDAAGFCLVSSAAVGSREVIAVVLGDKRDAIWTDSHRLLAWGLTRS